MKEFQELVKELIKQKSATLILAGILFLLLGITKELQVGTVSIAIEPAYRIVSIVIGTLLILTDIILAWRDSKEPSSTRSVKHLVSPPIEITVLKPERTLLSDFYLEQAGSSSNIDIIALTLQSALENFSEAKFIQWIRDGKHIRILMLSPSSTVAKIRSSEEASDQDFLPNKIMIQIKALKRLFTRAEKELKGQNYTGSLEVRLYDSLPYFSYFHTDKAMMMGLYYTNLPGLQSEALLINEKSSIHAKMCSHFDNIWTKSGKRGTQKMTVCSIGRGRSQFNNGLLEDPQTLTQ
jgi:hypothetical protein